MTSFLLMLNVFILLTAYYLIKPVREALILGAEGAEIKSYTGAIQALLFLAIVPIYGAFANRVNRLRLINGVTAFFLTNLVGFYILGRMHVNIGIPFFIWVGLVNVMLVAQVWAFANDIYTQEQGTRLFAIAGIGSDRVWPSPLSENREHFAGALQCGFVFGVTGRDSRRPFGIEIDQQPAPPLDVPTLRKEWQALREEARSLTPAALPSRETVTRLWTQLQAEAARQERSVFETSSMMAVSAVKALPDGIDRWLPRRLAALGTDGFGRSENRATLREFFEVDARFITVAALEQEYLLHKYKLYAALAFARANKLNKVMIDGPNRRLGIVVTAALLAGHLPL